LLVAGTAAGYYLYHFGLPHFNVAPAANQQVPPAGNETSDRNLAQKTNSGALADEGYRSTAPATDSSGESLATVNTGAVDLSTAPAAGGEVTPSLNATATPIANEAFADHPVFAELIRDPKLTLDEAFARLFSQWEIGSKAEGTAGECDWALQKGLRCLFGNSNWNFMRRLNRPVILEFLLKDYPKRYATLVALDEHRLTLDLGSQRLTFPLEQVLPFWQGRYILLWKPLSRNMPLLHPGNVSATVRQLRRRLAEIGMPETAVAEGASVYDEELKQRVIAFQTSRGIRPDGIVGPHTMIHLNTVLNPPHVPMLERRL
jgi:general secretion pathway protein A